VPALASSFDVGFGVANGVATAFLLGNLLGTLPGGWLVDRYGLTVPGESTAAGHNTLSGVLESSIFVGESWECQVRVGGGVPSATCRGWHPPSRPQVAVQLRVGAAFVPFQVPLKPKLVLWPAFKRPL
jgi:MFS family permease